MPAAQPPQKIRGASVSSSMSELWNGSATPSLWRTRVWLVSADGAELREHKLNVWKRLWSRRDCSLSGSKQRFTPPLSASRTKIHLSVTLIFIYLYSCFFCSCIANSREIFALNASNHFPFLLFSRMDGLAQVDAAVVEELWWSLKRWDKTCVFPDPVRSMWRRNILFFFFFPVCMWGRKACCSPGHWVSGSRMQWGLILPDKTFSPHLLCFTRLNKEKCSFYQPW